MSVGGWLERRAAELEERRRNPSFLAGERNRRLRDAGILANLARKHVTLRVPLPDVLGYAAAHRDEWLRL